MPLKPGRRTRSTTGTTTPSKNPFAVVGDAAAGAYNPTTTTRAPARTSRRQTDARVQYGKTGHQRAASGRAGNQAVQARRKAAAARRKKK